MVASNGYFVAFQSYISIYSHIHQYSVIQFYPGKYTVNYFKLLFACVEMFCMITCCIVFSLNGLWIFNRFIYKTILIYNTMGYSHQESTLIRRLLIDSLSVLESLHALFPLSRLCITSRMTCIWWVSEIASGPDWLVTYLPCKLMKHALLLKPSPKIDWHHISHVEDRVGNVVAMVSLIFTFMLKYISFSSFSKWSQISKIIIQDQ